LLSIKEEQFSPFGKGRREGDFIQKLKIPLCPDNGPDYPGSGNTDGAAAPGFYPHHEHISRLDYARLKNIANICKIRQQRP